MKRNLAFLASALLFGLLPARAAAPPEVTNVARCAASRDCFQWTAVPGATSYRIVRGNAGTLAGLRDASVDSCVRTTLTAPTTGPNILEPGPYGSFYWYLVTANDGHSDGTAGDMSDGPRVVNSVPTCPFICRADYIPQTNTSTTEDPGAPGCPPGMNLVDTFCVDRYEASLVRVSDGTPWPPQVNPDTTEVRAVCVAGVVPQAYIDEVRAAQACERSGKRLCSDAEWLRACRGPANSTYPYGNTRQPGVCNDYRATHPAVEYFGTTDPWIWSELDHPCLNQLPDSLDRAGANTGCVTAEGLYDMMGNLHEWTSDPAGTFRGGYYVDTSINGNGCLYVTTAHDVNFWDFSTGFRCCANPSP